jgi:hypothetical protein
MNNFNFISLTVKCPVCGALMMDHIHKIDNEPSIKLLLQISGKKGFLWLSSIYGSYNYFSDIDIPVNEITNLSCPSCKSTINSVETCNKCNAPMASLILDMGGRVSFCSRKGCQNHNIGFDDLNSALKKFYSEFGIRGRNVHEEVFIPRKAQKLPKTPEQEKKEIIETGSFLQAYCPHCKKSLIEDGILKLLIINENDETGFIMISPYLNVFLSKSTVYLPEDKEMKDISCFHCNTTLKVKDGKCGDCGTSIVRILVGARSKMIDFYICSRKGCYWHGLSKQDMEDIRLEDSIEW